jgi:hypothetical protein
MDAGVRMTKQYRPYFTLPELREIILCLKSHPTPARLSLVQKLESFCLKITHGVISSQYEPSPRKTILDRLELSDPPATLEISPRITGEAAYQKQLSDPLHCTPKEIAAAMEYRYMEGLMSKEEEQNYEKSIIAPTDKA